MSFLTSITFGVEEILENDRCGHLVDAGLALLGKHPAAATPGAYPASVTVTGRGLGHGDGLSQYGSLGYAVDYGWDWTAILAHYYGGTTRDQVPADSVVTVELSAFDGLSSTSIVHSGQLLATT